jgi:hypothetical protein
MAATDGALAGMAERVVLPGRSPAPASHFGMITK